VQALRRALWRTAAGLAGLWVWCFCVSFQNFSWISPKWFNKIASHGVSFAKLEKPEARGIAATRASGGTLRFATFNFAYL
jgi:hypothetical protein